MTMIPVMKKCPKCKKKYSWNPDVGKLWCPTCGPLSMPGAGDIPSGGVSTGKNGEIFGKFGK